MRHDGDLKSGEKECVSYVVSKIKDGSCVIPKCMSIASKTGQDRYSIATIKMVCSADKDPLYC